MMLRKFVKKQYKTPKDKHSLDTLIEDKKLIKEFGISCKKKIWRAIQKLSIWKFKLGKFIERKDQEGFNQLVSLLEQKGIVDTEGRDTLSIFRCLTLSNFFRRTLISIVSRILNVSPNTARVFIVHRRKVLLNGSVITLPYLFINKKQEKTLTIKGGEIDKKDPKKLSTKEESINIEKSHRL